MGEPIRWSISVDEETEQIGDSLQAEFAPIVGDNRSRLVQMIFKSWHRLGFTMETLATALSLGWLLPVYLSCHSIFNLCGWWGLIRPGVFESRAYLYFFAAGFGLVLIFALLVAISFPLDFWVGVFFVPLLVLAVLAGMFRLWFVGAEPSVAGKLSLIQGSVLLVCGVLALMALPERMEPERKSAALILGLFWLASGVFAWCYAVGGKSMHSANEYVPALIALLLFAWLAVAWNGRQRELAAQNARDEVAMTELQHSEAR